MIKVAVLASGNGTNAENIIRRFKDNKYARIEVVLTNNARAGVISRAEGLGIPVKVFSKEDLHSGKVLDLLKAAQIDFIVLAGFLLLVPTEIIKKYEGRIINIHPALLPANGGKGFYGDSVHKAVIESKSIISGITVHHVNEKFDDGEIIFQAACYVSRDDNAGTLAEKIHALEYSYFPTVIEKVIRGIFYDKPEPV